MNKRRSILAFAICFALLALTGLQVARADNDDDNLGNNSVTAAVSVAAGGVFDAYFCDPAGILNVTSGPLGAVTLTSTSTEVTVTTGNLVICYLDSKPLRPEFRTYIQSGNFSDGGSNSLPASGFKVTKAFWVLQSQWSSKNPPATTGIGDIGEYNGAGGQNQKDGGTGPLTWYGAWAPGTGSLDVWRHVHYGWEGRGTSDGTGIIATDPDGSGPSGLITVWNSGNGNLGSLGVIEVSLDIPDSTPAGNYSATVTLQVNFETP